MKFTEWNCILYHFYFDNANDEVFLFVDKNTLLQYVLDNHFFDKVFLILEEHNRSYDSNKSKLEYIWNDFCRIFKDRNHAYTPSLTYFCKLFSIKIAESSTDFPQVFPFIAICLMPYEESQGLNANNFYDRVNHFLGINGIIESDLTRNQFSSEFTKIKDLIRMWNNLGEWAKQENMPYTPKFVQRGRNEYVLPFFYECLITPTKRQLFSILFKNLGLAPNVDYHFKDEKVIQYLSNRYSDLGLSNEQWQKIKKECSSVYIDEFRRAYSKWDGSTWATQKIGHRKERSDCGMVHSLVLTMQNVLGSYKFFLKLFAPQIERGEYVSLSTDSETFDIRIGIDGYGQKPILKDNDLLFNALSNQENIVLHENKYDKAIHAPVDFYLFQQRGMEFTSDCSLIQGAQFFFLKRIGVKMFDLWLSENNATLIKQNIKKCGYDLYKIAKVLTPFPSEKKLSYGIKKTATLVNTFKLFFESNTYILSNFFPAFFSIEGIDVTTSVTATTYDSDNNAKNTYELEYCPESNLWKLPVLTNCFDRDRCFQLFNEGEVLSRYKFSFRDLSDLNCVRYAELRYNKWGIYDTQGDYQGLTLPELKASGIPPTMKENMEQTGYEPSTNQDDYQNSDYILYFFSSHSDRLVSKKEIKDFFYVLHQNKIINEDDIEYKLNRLLNNYCRLGYINYFYDKNNTKESHLISVNRPTFIMLPPKYEAEFIPGLKTRRFICVESWFKFLLSGARTPSFVNKLLKLTKGSKDIRIQISKSHSPLYPHEIIVWANTEQAIKELAEQLNIQLQFCVYSKELFERLGDIESYIEMTLSSESEFSYENVQSYKSIDFSKLDIVDTSKVYEIPSKNVINKEMDIVCYWPATYNEENILWMDGNVYPIEKFWANYVGAYNNHKQIVKVEDYHIITPYKFRLPVLYDRALTLISGNLPSIISVNGSSLYSIRQFLDYSLYDSPFININSEKITKKLNQHNQDE